MCDVTPQVEAPSLSELNRLGKERVTTGGGGGGGVGNRESPEYVCCRPGKRFGQCLRAYENTRRSFVMARREEKTRFK